MSGVTIAVVSPGDMGHVVGSVLAEKGYSVITSLEGRSDASRIRAERSGMRDTESLESLIREANCVLSIMPPEKAAEFAKEASAMMRLSGHLHGHR